MTSSFKKIDYSVRPAKHAERRMLSDIFRRVWPFQRVEDYVYVGFGSVWFADFVLFHRALGVREMISIEAAESAKDRIEENKPFRIPVIYKHSKQALLELDWNRKQFLWLDYDDPISTDVLYDLRTVSNHACSGTLLAVSVQCSRAPQVVEADRDGSANKLSAVERFVSKFGREKVPQETTEENLYGWPFGNLSRRMMVNEISAQLASRNSGSGADMRYHQICEIEYEDGAKMTTIVGIIHSEEDEGLVNKAKFDALDFIPDPLQAVRISVPKLTLKEFKKLESQLPLKDGGSLDLGSIPQSEARDFQRMYRYLPNFAVLES